MKRICATAIEQTGRYDHCNASRNGGQDHAKRPQTRRRTGFEQRRTPSAVSNTPHVATSPAATRPRRATDRRSRPQRWRDAVGELLSLQAAYADWLLAVLPDGLRPVPSPRRSKPLFNSTSLTWQASNRPAAMVAISKGPERTDAISLMGKKSRAEVTTIRT